MCVITMTVNPQGAARNLSSFSVTKTVNLCGQRSQVKSESEGTLFICRQQ